jgi:hypothetical protein
MAAASAKPFRSTKAEKRKQLLKIKKTKKIPVYNSNLSVFQKFFKTKSNHTFKKKFLTRKKKVCGVQRFNFLF